MRMSGKVGIITGAGTGIGRAGSLRFAAEGATVVVVSLSETEVAEVVEEIERADGTALGLAGDLSTDDFAREIVDRTVAEYGKLDYLWNHVGYPGPAQVENIDLSEFDKTINLNLKTGFVSTTQAIPHFRAQQAGSILFTASTSGLQASKLSPLYSTAKFGVVGLMRSLSSKYGPEGIRVNAVCPGPVDTPMLRQFLTRPDGSQVHEADMESAISSRGQNVPLQRIAQPDDVARAALFLSSDDASFITGVALPVDGGLTA